MRKFAKRYRAFMVRSSWISKFGCGVLALFAFYQVTDSIDAAGTGRASDLDPALLRAVILELLILAAFVLRYLAVRKMQFVSQWILSASWIGCAILGLVYIVDVNGGLPSMGDLIRIDVLSNSIWGFIVLSALRFLITAAMAFAVSLDDIDSYS
jgi:hypothetical protein